MQNVNKTINANSDYGDSHTLSGDFSLINICCRFVWWCHHKYLQMPQYIVSVESWPLLHHDTFSYILFYLKLEVHHAGQTTHLMFLSTSEAEDEVGGAKSTIITLLMNANDIFSFLYVVAFHFQDIEFLCLFPLFVS